MDSDVPAMIASVSGTLSRTETITAEQAAEPVAPPVLRLALHRPPPDRKVSWGEDTVDNEHMGKKKSKCCCIYHKPRKFDESSSSSDDECEHCFGHVERRKKNTESVTTPQEPPNDANLLCEVPIKTPPIDDQTPCEENPHPIENRSDQ